MEGCKDFCRKRSLGHIYQNSSGFEGEQEQPPAVCCHLWSSGPVPRGVTVCFHLSGRVDKDGTEADEKKSKVS